MHLSKEQLEEIKVRLKFTPYANLNYQDKLLYRLGFKVGYKIGLEHKRKFAKEEIVKTKIYKTIPLDKKLDYEKVTSLIEVVRKFYNITEQDFYSDRRFRDIVMARSICANIIREKFNYSTPNIAKVLHKKDHTTILHHLRMKHFKNNLWETGKKIWDDYKTIIDTL